MRGEKDESGSESDIESERLEVLKRKTGRLKCPVCGAPSRLRMSDGALICRDGGHITYPNGRVTLTGGIETTLSELREKGIIKEE